MHVAPIEAAIPPVQRLNLLIIIEGLLENSDDVPKETPSFQTANGGIDLLQSPRRHSRHAATSALEGK
jgi:hypothetical protein